MIPSIPKEYDAEGHRFWAGSAHRRGRDAVLRRLLPGIWATCLKTVPCLRWDEAHSGVSVDLVKIDVEGSERPVVHGMEVALLRDRPLILSEFAPFNLWKVGATDPFSYLCWFEERGD